TARKNTPVKTTLFHFPASLSLRDCFWLTPFRPINQLPAPEYLHHRRISTEGSMPGTKPAARRVFVVLRRLVALGLIGLGAAACGLQARHQAGSSHPDAGVKQSPGNRSRTSAGGPCTTEELKVGLDLKSAGVAAGTSLIPLDFTNVGTASCELSGFAEVSFVTSSSGHQIGPAATVDRSLSAQSLRLGAGSSA